MEQQQLFDVKRLEEELWEHMPEFVSENKKPYSSLTVHFANEEHRKLFFQILGQDYHNMRYMWFPEQKKEWVSFKPDHLSEIDKNKYPIYIISKGRWESCKTARELDMLNITYKLIIEPQEFDAYAEVIDKDKLSILPFSNLGQGSIPARNWVWEHAQTAGHKKHWILDDNIQGFYELNANQKKKVYDKNPFRDCEKFADRYENVALAGLNYDFFAPKNRHHTPFRLNTRIYSCILINHAIPYRWRGRYNEDTDLSLRALKDSWCTVLFNTFLCKKVTTMTMKGGNTDELYADDGRLKMAESLRDQHPDVVTITEKWGRFQHQVNYKPFKHNKLIPKKQLDIF